MIGHKDKALEVSTDPEQRFELALQLQNLDIAYELAERNSFSG
jgi:coatomer subunit beta'